MSGFDEMMPTRVAPRFHRLSRLDLYRPERKSSVPLLAREPHRRRLEFETGLCWPAQTFAAQGGTFACTTKGHRPAPKLRSQLDLY